MTPTPPLTPPPASPPSTSSEPPHADEHGAHGFHGPKCWIVTALVGLLLGFGLARLMPVRPVETTGSGDPHQASEAIVIIETTSSGEQHIRWPDESTTRLSVPFRTDDPAGVQMLKDATRHAPDPASSGHGGSGQSHHAAPLIPLALCVPFAVLLLSIALMPFISERFWHSHFPDFSFLLGAMVLAYYLAAFGGYGRHEMLHAGIEYYSFIALVGGLYVASGGILIDIRVRGRAVTNTGLLALGAVLANIVGTTGASVLLIRPFMRMNHGRLRPLHVLFFIFIVSNCGGCLTPIGDPPLYLGYLKGVPFEWTMTHLWPMWLLVNGSLLAAFFVFDSRVPPDIDTRAELAHGFHRYERAPLIAGWGSLGFLALLVAGVFIDPMIKRLAPGSGLIGVPVGATFQIVVAIVAYLASKPSIHQANQFTFAPVKEVGFLFVGIFLTMAPALGYLRANAMSFGLESPTQFYFGTGGLSALLDNAPTYLSFGQVAFGVLHLPLSPEGFARFTSGAFDIVHLASGDTVHFNGKLLLEAISLGAVFFGAMTYIGNGPNFMVKSIVESTHRRGGGLGVRMPSFFGYLAFAMCILLPVLLLNWLVFIR